LLRILQDNERTHRGVWLANFLCKHMPKEVASRHIETILDILADPPARSRVFFSDNGASLATLIPRVFRPQKWLDTSEIPQVGKLPECQKRAFLEWCNKACDPAWPETIPEAMRALVVRTGDTGLSAVYERLADVLPRDEGATKQNLSEGSPSASQASTLAARSVQTRLQLLVCATRIAPESPRVTRLLMETLEGETEPDWMLASEMMLSVKITKKDSSRLQAALRSWRDKRKHKYAWEGDYRFLFAIGASDAGIRLLDAELVNIEKMAASPPFYMFFLEDVAYNPRRYKPVLERLLNANVWWHRCAAMIMLYRYTDYFKTHPDVLRKIADNDREPFVRAVCRQVQLK